MNENIIIIKKIQDKIYKLKLALEEKEEICCYSYNIKKIEDKFEVNIYIIYNDELIQDTTNIIKIYVDNIYPNKFNEINFNIVITSKKNILSQESINTPTLETIANNRILINNSFISTSTKKKLRKIKKI